MMKGEYREEQEVDMSLYNHNHNHNQKHNLHPLTSSSTNSTPLNATDTHIFSQFQHRPKFLSPPPPPHFLSPHHHCHPQQPHPPSQLFENSEITPVKPTPPPPKKPKTTSTTTTSSEDGGTIELSRRPRGRPPGSRNRPKPAIIITREPDPNMSPYILELPNGSDLVDSLTRFTRRRGVGLCVLTATGAVTNVTLKQLSTNSSSSTVTFHGRFDILSLSAYLTTQTVSFNFSTGEFTISLAGPRGEIVGGKVVGRLVSSGTVYVVATSFDSPTFCRLPLELEHDNNNNRSYHEDVDRVTGGDGGGQSSSPVSQGGGGDGSGGTHVSLYSSSEVMWGSTTTTAAVTSARPPQPPY